MVLIRSCNLQSQLNVFLFSPRLQLYSSSYRTCKQPADLWKVWELTSGRIFVFTLMPSNRTWAIMHTVCLLFRCLTRDGLRIKISPGLLNQTSPSQTPPGDTHQDINEQQRLLPKLFRPGSRLTGYVQPAPPCCCRLLGLYGDWREDLLTLFRAGKSTPPLCKLFE